MCIAEWTFTYVYFCVIVIQIKLWNIAFSPEGSPLSPLSNFLVSDDIGFSLSFRRNDIMCNLLYRTSSLFYLCDIMPVRLIHVFHMLVCSLTLLWSILFFELITMIYCPTPLLMDIWVISNLELVKIKLLWTCTCFWWQYHLFLLDISGHGIAGS